MNSNNVEQKKLTVCLEGYSEHRNFISNLVALAQSRMAYKIEGYLSKEFSYEREENRAYTQLETILNNKSKTRSKDE